MTVSNKAPGQEKKNSSSMASWLKWAMSTLGGSILSWANHTDGRQTTVQAARKVRSQFETLKIRPFECMKPEITILYRRLWLKKHILFVAKTSKTRIQRLLGGSQPGWPDYSKHIHPWLGELLPKHRKSSHTRRGISCSHSYHSLCHSHHNPAGHDVWQWGMLRIHGHLNRENQSKPVDDSESNPISTYLTSSKVT